MTDTYKAREYWIQDGPPDEDKEWLKEVLEEARWESAVMELARKLVKNGRSKSLGWREAALDQLREI